jgi:RNA polymerase sigma-70 factor (ECF subfamily)
MENTDEQLKKMINLAQAGDSQAFASVYDLYIGKIYNFIFYKTLHQPLAEDLTSQTFLKAWKNIKQFQSGSFSAWLYSIARNLVIDHFRAQKEFLNIDDCWDLQASDDIFKEVDDRLKIEKIKTAFSQLNSKEREILILRFWQDLSFKEIALILQKNEGAVKMSFGRAVNALKKEMPLELFILAPLILNLWKKIN